MSWRTKAASGWLAGLPGVQLQHPLAGHTSLNIGGPADFFVEVGKTRELESLVEECARRGIPRLLLGAGTNLLVADAGVEGLVIRCVTRQHRADGTLVEAAAGLKMLRLARLCADADLTGFEWAIGVPGTVGGAVYQNAGCWGSELSEVLVCARGYAPGRGVASWGPDELQLGYRTSALREGALRGCLVTGAVIQLRAGDGARSRAQMAAWTEQRVSTQPIRTKNCGSVFKNPSGDTAGRLVEAAGLKGAREGGAQVSEQHANFIVNTGGASAAGVDALIRRIQQAVGERFGVSLETEVEKVGRW